MSLLFPHQATFTRKAVIRENRSMGNVYNLNRDSQENFKIAVKLLALQNPWGLQGRKRSRVKYNLNKVC